MESTREVEIEKYGSSGNINPKSENGARFVGYVMMSGFEPRWTKGRDTVRVQVKKMKVMNDGMNEVDDFGPVACEVQEK